MRDISRLYTISMPGTLQAIRPRAQTEKADRKNEEKTIRTGQLSLPRSDLV
jgi:hypothetical protein